MSYIEEYLDEKEFEKKQNELTNLQTLNVQFNFIRSLYHYFEEEIYLDSDDVGDIYLQIQYPNFSLKDLNPDWDDDEYFLDDEKLENFINDII